MYLHFIKLLSKIVLVFLWTRCTNRSRKLPDGYNKL